MAAILRAVCLSVVCLLGTGTARADWYALRNETDCVLIIREVVPMEGHLLRIKPKRLSPGETARESLPRPAVKHLIIHDPERPRSPLFDGTIRCEPGRAEYVITQVRDQLRVERDEKERVGK